MNTSPPHPCGLSRTEARIFDLLSDGVPRSPEAIRDEVIGRKYVSGHLVAVHISRLRKKVAEHGFAITCGRGGKAYQMGRVEA